MDAEGALRRALLGPPLNARADDGADAADAALDELDAHIRGIADLVGDVYHDSLARLQAEIEILRVLRTKRDFAGVAARRAVLLFALCREPEIAAHFAGRDGLAEDLRSRVLPLVTPLFLRHSAQAPDAYVTLALVLSELWRGETLGNYAGPQALDEGAGGGAQ